MNIFITPKFFLLILSLTLMNAVWGEDVISTKDTGEGTFEITLETNRVFDVPSATRIIAPTARKLCGDQNIELGKYSFDMNQAVTGDKSGDWFKLVQNIRCHDSTAEQSPSSRAPQLKDAAAEQAVRDKVSSLSKDYFERIYAQMGDDASAALAAIRGGNEVDRSAIFETVTGTPTNIDLFRLTLYDNLPSAPADGIYVAVDYDNQVGNVVHHCGYLMWHSYDGKEFKLGRVESGTLSEEMLAKIPEDQLPSLLKQLRCSNFYDE